MTPRRDAPVDTLLINFVPSSCQAIFLPPIFLLVVPPLTGMLHG